MDQPPRNGTNTGTGGNVGISTNVRTLGCFFGAGDVRKWAEVTLKWEDKMREMGRKRSEVGQVNITIWTAIISKWAAKVRLRGIQKGVAVSTGRRTKKCQRRRTSL